MFTRLSAVAVSITCALALAACGGSDSGGDGTAAKGAIKIMVTGPIEAQAYSLTDLPFGAQVAADQLNDDGGIGGRKVEIVVCNDKGDPNTALQCARQAVKDKVAAVVGGLEIFDGQVNPILERANIPWIAPATVSVFNAKNQFFVYNDTGVGFAALALYMGQQGCTKLAGVKTPSGTDATMAQVEEAAKVGGATYAGTFTSPASGADYAPLASAIAAKGAECVVATASPAEMGPLLGALKTVDPTILLGATTGSLPTPMIASMKGLADGVLAFTGYYPNSTQKGDVQEVLKAAAAANPKVLLDSFVLQGYAGVQIFAEAAKGLDDITNETILKALPKITNFDTKVGPVVDFSTPNPVAAYSRLFQAKSFIAVVKGADYVLAQDEPIDAQPILDALK